MTPHEGVPDEVTTAMDATFIHIGPPSPAKLAPCDHDECGPLRCKREAVRAALELAARIDTGQDCPAENHAIACAAMEALEAVRDPAGGETPETDALMTLIRDTGESIWQAGRLNEGCLFGPIPHDMDLIREKIAALERRARRAEEALAGLSAQPVSLNSNHQSGTITP